MVIGVFVHGRQTEPETERGIQTLNEVRNKRKHKIFMCFAQHKITNTFTLLFLPLSLFIRLIAWLLLNKHTSI